MGGSFVKWRNVEQMKEYQRAARIAAQQMFHLWP
jgi:hypothetical protein